LFPGYQSHYIVTDNEGIPFTDYDSNIQSYDELVVNQESQVVPLFLLRLDLKSVDRANEEFSRTGGKIDHSRKYQEKYRKVHDEYVYTEMK